MPTQIYISNTSFQEWTSTPTVSSEKNNNPDLLISEKIKKDRKIEYITPSTIVNLSSGDKIKNSEFYTGLININSGSEAEDISIYTDGTLRINGSNKRFFILFDYHGKAEKIKLEGGLVDVNSGGKLSGLILKAGLLSIKNDGLATFSTIYGGRVEVGGLCGKAKLDSTLVNGGQVEIRTNGEAYNSTLNSGKFEIKNNGKTDLNIINGGEFNVQSGRATSNIVNNGEFNVYYSESAAIANTVNGGELNVCFGAVASMTTVNGGKFNVEGGNVTLNEINQGEFNVYSGGIAKQNKIYGGRVNVNKEGGWFNDKAIIDKSVIASGGMIDVHANGVAQNTTIQPGGTLRLKENGFFVQGSQAVNTIIEKGGCLVILPGAKAINTTIGQCFYPEIRGEDSESFKCIA